VPDTWTIRSALEWTQGYLERKGDENPRLAAQWLLSKATSLSRIELYAHFDKPLSADEREVLREIVARRGSGEPLQYIMGEVGFRHLMIQVRPGVLIPRPETEVLVSEALAILSSKQPESDSKNSSSPQADPVLVADIGTGSGCIAASIAHEYPAAQVFAGDISPEAVELARENVERLGLLERVSVFEGNLTSAIPEEYQGKFSLLISNPPYIPRAVLESLSSEVVDFEPRLALDGGNDGLEVFRALLAEAYEILAPDGAAVFELHETCLEQAAALAEEAGFAATRIVRDLAQRPRVLIAFMPSSPYLA
jgi:release factor glutamine methyltransferase